MNGYVALVGAALAIAGRGGIVPFGDVEVKEVMRWLAGNILEERRGMKNPNERALQLWRELIETQPGRFPGEGGTIPHGPIYGRLVKGETGPQSENAIYTTEAMFKATGIPVRAGVGARAFLSWCVEQGHCKDETGYIDGQRQRWKVFSGTMEHS